MRDMEDRTDRAKFVRDLFHRYIDAKRDFQIAAEQCSVKSWPDRKAELRNAFRLQELFNEREAVRFDELTQACVQDSALWKSFSSISNISKRLHEDWSGIEENALKKSTPAYVKILTEIDACQKSLNSNALDGALRMVQRDPEYASARRALQARLRELEDQLADLQQLGR